MSSMITFVFKKDNQFTVFDITSGGLRNFYDPKIFEGKKEAIDEFIQKAIPDNIVFQKPNKEIISEFDYFIIMDFDKKEIIHYQPARYMECLSGSIDMTWLHIDEWRKTNQLVKGLVNPETMEVMVQFPEKDLSSMELRKFVDNNQTKLPLDEEGDLILSDDHVSYCIAIAPVGWTFINIDVNKSVEEAINEVQEYWQ